MGWRLVRVLPAETVHGLSALVGQLLAAVQFLCEQCTILLHVHQAPWLAFCVGFHACCATPLSCGKQSLRKSPTLLGLTLWLGLPLVFWLWSEWRLNVMGPSLHLRLCHDTARV